MVRWIGTGGGGGSPIADAISQYAALRYGDTLTPALKQEQLAAAQRQAQSLLDLQGALRNSGNAWGGVRPPTGGGVQFRPPAAPRPQPSDRMALPGQEAPDFALPAPDVSTGMTGGADLSFDVPPPVVRGAGPGAAAIRAGLLQRGLPPHVADAFIVNFQDESGLNPGVNEIAPIVPGSRGGFGLAQWTGPRRVALEQFAAARGVGPDDMDTQLDFLMTELQGSEAAAAQGILGAPDAATAAQAIVRDFLRPLPQHVASRMDRYADAFTGGAAPAFLPGATASPLNGAPALDPGQYNPMNAAQNTAEMLALAAGAGIDPSQVGDMLRLMTATSFGAENQATTDAFVGAGGRYEDTYSGFSADQNRQERDSVRDSNVTMRNKDVELAAGVETAENALVTVIRDGRPVQVRKRDLLPTDNAVISNAEVQGLAALEDLPNMTDAERRAYTGSEPRAAEAIDVWFDPDTGQRWRTADNGRTDYDTGETIPPTAIPRVGAAANATDAVALDKINARTTESQEINRQMFEAVLGDYETIVRDSPTSVGMVGWFRRQGQNAVQQYDQFKQAFPEQAAAVEARNSDSVLALETAIQRNSELDANGVLRGFLTDAYDPSLSQLQLYANILPYTAAAALAGQEGRSVTDADVQRFQQVVGDPTSFWSNQQDLLTKVDTIRRMLSVQREAAQRIRRDGIDGPIAPSGPTVPASDLSEDELRWLEGGQ